MKISCKICVNIIFIILMCFPVNATNGNYLIKFQTLLANCPHGLHQQPNGGPYSVFVFCDDAGGTNIGIILSEPGAGTGKLKIPGPTKIWNWYPYERFWQERNWAADITSFAWSPTFKYVYIATSRVYGDGGVFKLDLMHKRAHKITIVNTDNYNLEKLNHGSIIKSINLKKNKLLVSTWVYDPRLKKKIEFDKEIPLE